MHGLESIDRVGFFSILFFLSIAFTALTGILSRKVPHDSWQVKLHGLSVVVLFATMFVTACVVDNVVRQKFKATPLFLVHAIFLVFLIAFALIGLFVRGTKYPDQHWKIGHASLSAGMGAILTGLILHYG